MVAKNHIFGLILLGALLCEISAPALAAPAASRLPGRAADPEKGVEEKPIPLSGPCNRALADGANCLGQMESFKRTSQAYSYLAFYMQNYSAYGRMVNNAPAEVKKNQEAVAACLTGKCDQEQKDRMMAALIQYNLGKGVKSMILKSRTNKENMASLSVPRQKDYGMDFSQSTDPALLKGKQQMPRQTGAVYKDSFKITKRDLAEATAFRVDPKLIKEKADLGAEFKRQWESFIDEYAATTNTKQAWNYEYAQPKQTGGEQKHDTWVLDPDTKAPRLNNQRFMEDVQTQNSKMVKDTVDEFKKSLKKPVFEREKEEEEKKTMIAGTQPKQPLPGQAKPDDKQKPKKDPNALTVKSDLDKDLRFSDLGLGMPLAGVRDSDKKVTTDPREISVGIVGTINSKIDETMAKKRSLASKKDTIMDVQIGVANFDAYLDKIWPPSQIKNKIPSKNK